MSFKEYQALETMYALTMLLLLTSVKHNLSYSNGAPFRSCQTMTPRHFQFGSPVEGETIPSPYTLNAAWDNGLKMFKVSVGGSEFQGFLLQARVKINDSAIGSFVNINQSVAQHQDCIADQVFCSINFYNDSFYSLIIVLYSSITNHLIWSFRWHRV